MRRRVLNLVALLSLIPPAAVAVLWVRGYHEVDRVQWSTRVDPRAGRADAWSLVSGKGVVAVLWERETWLQAALPYLGYLPAASRQGGFSYSTLAPANVTVRTETFWQRLGFARHDVTDGGPASAWSRRTRLVRLPHWFLLLSSAVPPTAALRSRRRRKGGLCVACGYDLRATPGRCPECGHVPTR
ncbi:MAG TPA: hypothetical protein VFB66_23020 [Tepidisphaeraceae bacterium]|nr:hypothetical protein [Tepidisphaeraceae bacterium]